MIALRTVRDELGLTQAELAKLSGLSLSAVTAYEHGSRIPRADNLRAIADGLAIFARDPSLVGEYLERLTAQWAKS